jgi:hypothetical protein
LNLLSIEKGVKNMKRTNSLAVSLFFVFVMLSNVAVGAEYAGDLDILRVRVVGDTVTFGTAQQPTNTCSFFGYYFQFDASTSGGERMFSVISQAKAMGKKLEVWYDPSTVPGAYQYNGCQGGAIAVVRGVAFN